MALKTIAVGILGKDATVNKVGDSSVINFSIAHTERFTSKGEKKEKTTWIECSYWVKETKVAQYLTKGSSVWVEGLPEAKAYKSNDGSAKASLCLNVGRLEFVGGKSSGSKATEGSTSKQEDAQDEPASDLPF